MTAVVGGTVFPCSFFIGKADFTFKLGMLKVKSAVKHAEADRLIICFVIPGFPCVYRFKPPVSAFGVKFIPDKRIFGAINILFKHIIKRVIGGSLFRGFAQINGHCQRNAFGCFDFFAPCNRFTVSHTYGFYNVKLCRCTPSHNRTAAGAEDTESFKKAEIGVNENSESILDVTRFAVDKSDAFSFDSVQKIIFHRRSSVGNAADKFKNAVNCRSEKAES